MTAPEKTGRVKRLGLLWTCTCMLLLLAQPSQTEARNREEQQTTTGVWSIPRRILDASKFAVNGLCDRFHPSSSSVSSVQQKQLSEDLSRQALLGGELSTHPAYRDVQSPKAKRSARRIFCSAAALAVSLAGLAQVQGHYFTNWASQRLAAEQAAPQVTLVDKSSVDRALDTSAETIAAVEQFSRHTLIPGLTCIPGLTWGGMWEFNTLVSGSTLALFAKGALKKNLKNGGISPRELLAGISEPGRGLTVGVVDQGGMPKSGFARTDNMPRGDNLQVLYFSAEGDQKPGTRKRDVKIKKMSLKDDPPHGVAVLDLVAGAAGGASKAVFVQPSISDKESKALDDFFEQGVKDPSTLTLDRLNGASAPIIKSIAEAVRVAIDKGADVINVSLSADQPGKLTAQMQQLLSVLGLAGLKSSIRLNQLRAFFSSKYRTSSGYRVRQDKLNAEMAEKKKVLRALQQLVDAQTTEVVDAPKLRALYEPLAEVLRYADAVSADGSRNVSIHFANGNMGDYTNSIGRGNVLGLANLASLEGRHPRLMLYGSIRHEGQRSVISEFSSEGTDTNPPNVAANGEDIVFSTSRTGHLGNLMGAVLNPWNLLEPWRRYEQDANRQGTSFSSPHGAAACTAITGEFKKQGFILQPGAYERLTALTADPVYFDAKYLRATLVPEIVARLTKQYGSGPDQLDRSMIEKELIGEARRRVGAGALNPQRMLAVSRDLMTWARQQGSKRITEQLVDRWFKTLETDGRSPAGAGL